MADASPGGPEASPESAVGNIAERLKAQGQTLAVAETSAGGLVSARLTALPGSSAWFLGGVVAYSNFSKGRWLGLGPEEIRATGSVSAVAALALARAVRASLGATWGAAETGIAGPQTGRRSSKPSGLGYVAVVGETPEGTVERFAEVSTGVDDRALNQAAFASALLRLLRETVD